jgi:diketogulonate reductase-like aldo/keto reductase
MNICLGLSHGGTNNEIIFEFINKGNKILDISSTYGGILNLKSCLLNSNINRKDLFIVCKLWLDELGNNRTYDTHEWGSNDVKYYAKKIITELNCSYIDCLLIHWPLKLDTDFISDEFIIPEIWIQMERLVDIGVTKKIGLSNFGILEIQQILNTCRIKPYINQIEVSLLCNNNNVADFCKKNEINVMAHSIFRKDTLNNEWWQTMSELNTLENKYKATKYQVILNWIKQKNIIPIFSTTKLDNLHSNLEYNSFTLSEDEVIKLDKLNLNQQLRVNEYNIHNTLHNVEYNFYKNYEVSYCDNENLEFRTTFTNDKNFLQKCRDSLTKGPGFLIVKNLFSDKIQEIRNKLPESNSTLHRWNFSVVNRDLSFCQLIDNIVITTIVETILGWDFHLDNTAFSYSKYENNLAVPFGPHIDSPFDMKPGAKLPPFDYPLVLQCLYIFDDMNKDNGAFYSIPYSHKIKLRCNLFSEGNLKIGVVPTTENIYIHEANAGDVIICLGNLWHGALSNNNKENRRLLLAEFVSSIIEKRNEFGQEPDDMEILKKCSRKFIRILNEGRYKWRFPKKLLEEWKKHQKKLILKKFI